MSPIGAKLVHSVPCRIVAFVLVMVVAGCHKDTPTPEPTATAAREMPTDAATQPPTDTPQGAALDTDAIHELKFPDRLLRYYAAALEQGRWDLAARAWRTSSGVTAETLKASYDRGSTTRLTFGTAEAEGGAGSIYYEVPVTLRFGNAAPEKGTLTLRRVNDVDGATPEQLDWRIERSTIGAGQ